MGGVGSVGFGLKLHTAFILVLQITRRPLFCLYYSGSHLSQEGVNLLGQPIPSLYKSVGPQSIKYKNGECLKLERVVLDLKALIQDQLFLLALILSLSTLKVDALISTSRYFRGHLCSNCKNSNSVFLFPQLERHEGVYSSAF